MKKPFDKGKDKEMKDDKKGKMKGKKGVNPFAKVKK